MDKGVWYYMLGEEKEGPISHKELQEKLDRGEVDPTTKIWTESQNEWLPISEVEHFNLSTLDEAPTIEVIKKVEYSRETDQEYVPPRPWVRFWARMVDYSLFFIVLSFIIAFFDIYLGTAGAYLQIIAIFLWVFVETLLLCTVGTTPGKWLLKVTVRDENHQKLSFSSSLNRSFSVWWLGMGAGVPIVSLITMIVAAVKLSNTGSTSWDKHNDFRVFHNKIGMGRTLLVILYFVCYAWFLAWGQLQMLNRP
ncbi:MAG: RDD family protein [Chlamydiia bacterium]|nr:RDD family protein [Chlamydiia bacterium]